MYCVMRASVPSVYRRLYAICLGVIIIPQNGILTVVSYLGGTITSQFTLTYISTGGPATTVTWTRDSVTVTDGTETVLDDPVTAQYTHTLTVTGRLPGLYTCTVANDKPSAASESFRVIGKGYYMCSYITLQDYHLLQ